MFCLLLYVIFCCCHIPYSGLSTIWSTVVTECTIYVNTKSTAFSPHSVFMFFVWFRQNCGLKGISLILRLVILPLFLLCVTCCLMKHISADNHLLLCDAFSLPSDVVYIYLCSSLQHVIFGKFCLSYPERIFTHIIQHL